MTLPDIDDGATYGGVNLVDFGGQAVVDPTTDRGASAVNPLVASAAMMTHTALRAWARITTAGTGAPTLTAGDSVWNWASNTNAAMVPTRTSAGKYTLTFPATVVDQIPSGAPGALVSPHNLNLRAGWLPPVLFGGTLYQPVVNSIAGNVVTVWVLSGTTPTDTTGLVIDGFFL
jgi:hypothetical protein